MATKDYKTEIKVHKHIFKPHGCVWWLKDYSQEQNVIFCW